LVEKAEARGNQLMGNLRDMNCPLIKDIRGRGLLTAIEFHEGLKFDGTEFSNILLKNGILARASYLNMMRFSPALVTTEAEIDESCEIIHESLKEFEAIN
jgi:ornithine--oxo-acid transaminase